MRKAARLDEAGDLILPGDQDRSRWHHGQIADDAALLQRAPRRGHRHLPRGRRI